MPTLQQIFRQQRSSREPLGQFGSPCMVSPLWSTLCFDWSCRASLGKLPETLDLRGMRARLLERGRQARSFQDKSEPPCVRCLRRTLQFGCRAPQGKSKTECTAYHLSDRLIALSHTCFQRHRMLGLSQTIHGILLNARASGVRALPYHARSNG